MGNKFGDRRTNKEGYVHVYLPGVPGTDKSGWISEHRMVAALTLGRRLLKTEIVHHKNQIKNDNRPENLQVFMSHAEHFQEHVRIEKGPYWEEEKKRRKAKLDKEFPDIETPEFTPPLPRKITGGWYQSQ